MKILVVDDEPLILMLTSTVLAALNLSVQTATGLREAKETLSVQSFDLVISDLSMTGCMGTEGFELLGHIKNVSRRTEVFIMTGYGNEDIRRDAYARGACWFVEKPLNLREFRERVREVALSKGFVVA